MALIYRTGLILLALSMIALPEFSSAKAQPTHLNLWYAADPTDPFRTVLESAAGRFNAAHTDLQFDPRPIAGADYNAQLQVAIASGNPPDVFSTIGGYELQTLVRANVVREIPELSDEVRRQSAPGAFDSTTFDAKRYAIPTTLAGVFLWYNADLFQAHAAELPTTWSKLIDACKQFKASGIIPISLGNQDKWPGALWLASLTNRVEPTAPLMNGVFSKPAYIQASQKIQEAVHTGCFPDNFNTLSDTDARLLLANGKAAMQLQGSWNLGGLKQANQGLTQTSLRTLLFPTLEGSQGDSRRLVGSAAQSFAIAAKAPSGTGAALLELLSSDAFNQALAENDIISARLGYAQAVHDPIVKQMALRLAEAPSLQLYDDQRLPPEPARVQLSTTQQLFALTLTPEQAADALDQALTLNAQNTPKAQNLQNPQSASPTPATSAPLRQLAQAHGIYIGAAVAAIPLRSKTQYQSTLKREFNMLTPENALKIGVLRPTRTSYNFTDADTIINFAQANGMQVRGHTLVYGKYLPDWLNNGRFSRDELLAILHEYIQTVVGRYRGRISAWDVVNEAVDENGTLADTLFLRTIGPDYIEYAFRWAHEADPQAQLFYNDYGGEDLSAKSNGIYTLVQDLHKRGVPIDGVGLQMHLSLVKPIKMADVAANIERLGALGLQVHITELDVETKGSASSQQDQLTAQANIYHDVARACLHSSACKAIITWGFTDQSTWLIGDTPLPFDKNYQPKPAYYALRQALLES